MSQCRPRAASAASMLSGGVRRTAANRPRSAGGTSAVALRKRGKRRAVERGATRRSATSSTTLNRDSAPRLRADCPRHACLIATRFAQGRTMTWPPHLASASRNSVCSDQLEAVPAMKNMTKTTAGGTGDVRRCSADIRRCPGDEPTRGQQSPLPAGKTGTPQKRGRVERLTIRPSITCHQ